MKIVFQILLWAAHLAVGLWSFTVICFHIFNDKQKPDEGKAAIYIFLGNLALILYAFFVAYIY